jgi:Uma2 family endonuclease
LCRAGHVATLGHMSTRHAVTVATTAEELLELPTGEGVRYELIKGRLHVMPAGTFEHGRIAANVVHSLATHVHATGTGIVLTADVGFSLARDPDTVRAPDVAYVSNERVAAVGPFTGCWPGGAPDLVVEVVSPRDSHPDIHAKTLEWLEGGAHAVLVLHPRSRSATVYRPGDDVRSYTEGTIDLGDAVPGWKVALADFFA